MRAYAASWLVLLRPLLLLLVHCSLFMAASCSRATWHAPLVLPAAGDTVYVGAGLAPALGKIKARTVIIQTGTGNVASTADKVRADAVASGAGSTASATTNTSVPWWVLLVIGAVAWEWVSSYLPRLWLPWRVRPG